MTRRLGGTLGDAPGGEMMTVECYRCPPADQDRSPTTEHVTIQRRGGVVRMGTALLRCTVCGHTAARQMWG